MGTSTYARKHTARLSAAQGQFFDAIPITNPGHLWTELTTTSDVAPNRGVLSGLLMSGPQLLLPGTTQLIAVLSVRRNHACSDLIFSRWLCRVLPSSDLGVIFLWYFFFSPSRSFPPFSCRSCRNLCLGRSYPCLYPSNPQEEASLIRTAVPTSSQPYHSFSYTYT